MFRDVRIFFNKVGAAKFISHLDLNRFMLRAVRRAKLPIWYTEGFNTHPYITFAQPLSLGTESVCEVMDMRVTTDISFDEIKEKLSAVMPPDIVIKSAAKPIHKPKEIMYADYEIAVRFAGKSGDESADILERLYALPEIPVEKKSKKGTKIIDIKELIISFEVCREADFAVLKMRVISGVSGGLNPSLIVSAACERFECTAETDDVVKTAVLLEDGSVFA